MKKIVSSFTRVFKKPRYVVLALSVAAATFTFFVLLRHTSFLTQLVSLPIATSAKFSIIWNMLIGIPESLGVTSAFIGVATAALFGINSALLTFLLVRGGTLIGKALGTGIIGVASGVFGIGCAACGSLLLVTLFSATGIATAFAVLPLKGGELGILSVLLLGATAGILLNRIGDPLVCPPETS